MKGSHYLGAGKGRLVAAPASKLYTEKLRIALSLYGSISLTLARHVRTSDPALSR
jgi:hypothetical protein